MLFNLNNFSKYIFIDLKKNFAKLFTKNKA